MDAFDRGEAGDDFEEGGVLDGAGFAEAGADGGERVVVVAGMANEFPEAVGHGMEKLLEGGRVERAGGENSDGPAGGGKAGEADEAEKGGAAAAEDADFEAAQGGCSGGGGECPVGFEGIAHGPNAAARGGPEQRLEDGREDVGVLVGVHVGDGDAGLLEALDLGGGFGFDFLFADAAQHEVANKFAEGGAEFVVLAEQGGDLLLGRGGLTVDQNDVAAYAQGRRLACGPHGIVEGGSGCHEGGGGERALYRELKNGAVDALGEAEVVGVDDEFAGWMGCWQWSGSGGELEGWLIRFPE